MTKYEGCGVLGTLWKFTREWAPAAHRVWLSKAIDIVNEEEESWIVRLKAGSISFRVGAVDSACNCQKHPERTREKPFRRLWTTTDKEESMLLECEPSGIDEYHHSRTANDREAGQSSDKTWRDFGLECDSESWSSSLEEAPWYMYAILRLSLRCFSQILQEITISF